MAIEHNEWEGSPSQVTNYVTFFVCALISLTVVGAIIAIPYALWQYLVVKNIKFELTSQRLKVHSGVLSKLTEELELYRVRDIGSEEPFFLRLFGLGNVIIVSSDATTPISKIIAINDVHAVRDKLRNLVEVRREQKGVRMAEIE
jgi:membrane protein YdbS with pleckstrin-like domain